MNNITLFLLINHDVYAQYHNGIGFLAAASAFNDALNKGAPDLNRYMEAFEMYLAQVKLAVQTGNRF